MMKKMKEHHVVNVWKGKSEKNRAYVNKNHNFIYKHILLPLNEPQGGDSVRGWGWLRDVTVTDSTSDAGRLLVD